MLESGTARLRALLTVAVTAIVAVAWLCWWRTPAPAVAPATSLVSRPPVVATAPASSPPPMAEAERMPAAPTVTAPLLVRGRCLAVENDEPLAVTLHVGEDDGAEGSLASDDLATAASGTDGRFEFGVAFTGAKDLRLMATAPGRAPVSCRRESSQAGEVWDVGDVRLTLAARVSGEVVDATGEHVAAAQVALRMLGPELPAMSFRSTHLATTDAAGRFAMTAAVAAGEWYVGVDGTGALLTPRKTQVPAGGEHFVRIEVERPDPRQAITGRVVDSAGAPIAGAGLAAYGEGARGRAVSAADGTFLLHRGPPHFDRGKPGVELTVQAPSFEQVPAAGATVAWGQRDVVLVMRPLSTVLVRAIDSRGARLAGFDLLYGQITASGTWLDYAMAKAKPVADGVLLTGLRSGPHVLLLRPREDGQAVAGPEPFAVGAAAPDAVTVRVPDRVDVQVEVIDAAAAPVPQCELDLIARLGDAPVDSGLPAPRLRGLRSAGLRGSRQLALAAGSTDARGIATLAAPPGRFSLFARCRTHLPVTQQVVVVANQPRIRVVLEAATVLHGRLTPVELLPAFGIAESKPERRLAVVARGPAAGTAPARAAKELARGEVAADGTFTLGPLPRGVATLRLHAWLEGSAVHAAVVQHALGEIDAVGGVVEREFAVAAFAPATVTGIVLLDGQPVVDGQFFLRRIEPEPRAYVRIATGKDGRFRTRVSPGLLGAQLAIPSQPGPGHVILPLPERWTVGAGASAELRVEGRTRVLRLRLSDRDGRPLGNRRVRADSADGYNRPGSLTSDAEGVVEITPAPYDEFTVRVQDDPGPELVSPLLQVPDGDGPAALAVRLGK